MTRNADYALADAKEWAREGLYVPGTFPPVEGVVVGMDGSVWLERTDDGGPLAWLGLGPDGSVLGGCETSQRTRILATTSDRVWGSTTDELDVPYIVRYDVGPARFEPEGSE